MGIDINFKHGITVGSPFCITISKDAEFWNMEPGEAFSALCEAKGVVKYAADLCYIYNNDYDNNIWCLGGSPEALTAMRRIDENVFADVDDKKYCHDALKRYDEHLSKKVMNRSPNRTLRKRIIERDKSKCRYCGNIVIETIHIDHVVPYSLGGRTELENLVVACSGCNLRKSGKTLQEAGMKLL